MIIPFQPSGNSEPFRHSSKVAAPPFLVGSMVITVWLGLLVTGRAEAVDIPALIEIPSAIAAANPELVQQREALVKDRELLGTRARSHTSTCRAVEEGSAAEANCIQSLKALASIGNAHIETSKQFNSDLRTALHHAASSKPAAVTDPSVVDATGVPSGLPKGVENAIANAYASAPPGVSDRVRRGFLAVGHLDWNLATALFRDALNRDPGNANLKRFVALTEAAQQSNIQPATVDTRNEPAGLGGTSDFAGAIAMPDRKKQDTSLRQGAVPPRQTLTSLNASASTMSTEQVMKALEDILEDAFRK